MKTIWKHPLSIEGSENIIATRKDAEIISADYQGHVPTIWMIVDPDAPVVRRSIVIVGTGHPLPETIGEHIGTLVDDAYALVWHVFDAGEVGDGA